MVARSLKEAIAEANAQPNFTQKFLDIVRDKEREPDELQVAREAFVAKHGAMLKDYIALLRYDADHSTGKAKTDEDKADMRSAADAMAPLLAELNSDPDYFSGRRDKSLLILIKAASLLPEDVVYSDDHAARMKLAGADLEALSKKHKVKGELEPLIQGFITDHQSAIYKYVRELETRMALHPKLNTKAIERRANYLKTCLQEMGNEGAAFFECSKDARLANALRDALKPEDTLFSSDMHYAALKEASVALKALSDQFAAKIQHGPQP